MLVLISYHNAYFYYISNIINSYKSKTKYNAVAINTGVCTNMTTKESVKMELNDNFMKRYKQNN